MHMLFSHSFNVMTYITSGYLQSTKDLTYRKHPLFQVWFLADPKVGFCFGDLVTDVLWRRVLEKQDRAGDASSAGRCSYLEMRF